MIRGGDVRCDVCEHWIPGKVYFHNSLMVCHSCYQDLTKDDEKKARIPTVAFATTFLVSSGVAYLVDTWPLVDSLAILASGFSFVPLVYRGAKYMQGRLA